MNKPEIRAEIKKRIEELSVEQKKRESVIVSKKIIDNLQKKNFKILVTYEAFADEVDISDVTSWADKNNKIVIPVPQSSEPMVLSESSGSICIVPGRAFTADGKRIGRGTGWYDRFLTQYPGMDTIGVCFDCQIFPDLPQMPHDRVLTQVVFPGNDIE